MISTQEISKLLCPVLSCTHFFQAGYFGRSALLVWSVFIHVTISHANSLIKIKVLHKKEFNSHSTGLEHQYGCRDVM